MNLAGEFDATLIHARMPFIVVHYGYHFSGLRLLFTIVADIRVPQLTEGYHRPTAPFPPQVHLDLFHFLRRWTLARFSNRRFSYPSGRGE
jgi:hypothetical protein